MRKNYTTSKHFFEREIKDGEGNVTSTETINSSSYKHTNNNIEFLMLNISNDTYWLNEFQNVNEFHLLLRMLRKQDSEYYTITMNQDLYDDISEHINLSKKTIMNILASLVNRNILKRKSKGTYMIHPDMLLKGNTYDYQKKIDVWNNTKTSQSHK